MYSSRPRNLWIQCRKPNPAASARLICLPYAGGNASIYQNWPRLLTEEIEVLAVQLPGRGSRLLESRYTDVSQLIPAILQEIAPYADKPILLFGHSMGALLSLELAHQLEELQPGVLQHVFVSAYRAVHLPSRRNQSRHLLPDHEFKELLRRLNGTPEELLDNQELMDMILPIMRADMQLCDTYLYQDRGPLPCGITVFGGRMDQEVSEAQLVAWKDHTNKDFKLHMLPGDHFFIHSQEEALIGLVRQETLKLIDKNSR